MNNKRYINSFGLSGIFALIGFGLCCLNFDITADTPVGCILWAAELFAVCLTMGVLGLETELFLRRKRFVAVGRKSIVISIAFAVLAGAVIGSAGQAVYGFEGESYRTSKQVDVETENTHVVLLLDYSGSMGLNIQDEVDVTCQLIDGLNKNVSMQVVAFSDTVEARAVSDFLSLTDSNKSTLQNFVRNIDIFHGGTNFDLPLEVSYNTLSANEERDCRSVVVMLSDYEYGGYIFTPSTGDAIKNAGYEIYSVRLTYQSGQTMNPNDAFSKYVDKDIPIVKANDGSIDTEELLDALTESVAGTQVKTVKKTKLSLGEEPMTAQQEPEWWRILIRAVFYGLASMAAGWIYYGFESAGKLLMNFGIGVCAAAVSLINPVAGFIVLALAGFGSFTRFEITEERQNA